MKAQFILIAALNRTEEAPSFVKKVLSLHYLTVYYLLQVLTQVAVVELRTSEQYNHLQTCPGVYGVV